MNAKPQNRKISVLRTLEQLHNRDRSKDRGIIATLERLQQAADKTARKLKKTRPPAWTSTRTDE